MRFPSPCVPCSVGDSLVLRMTCRGSEVRVTRRATFLLESGSGLSLWGGCRPQHAGQVPVPGLRVRPLSSAPCFPRGPAAARPHPCTPRTRATEERRGPRGGVGALDSFLDSDFSCVRTLEGRCGVCRQRDSGANTTTFVCRLGEPQRSLPGTVVSSFSNRTGRRFRVRCAVCRGAGWGAAPQDPEPPPPLPARTSVLSWEVLTCRGLCS